ncbi:RapZ C-terminal domain-containing protein [Corynebacterium aquilae]|uniref:RapZ C-terminal domain-containing protein n=1 Tax=Corynebacterium aquilae TaxID=203263 RepID=UPI0012EE7A95
MILITSSAKGHATPADAVVDCGSLQPAPESLREFNGTHPHVADYVLNYHPGTIRWLTHIVRDVQRRACRSMGSAPLTVACVSPEGRNRAVAVADFLAERLAERGLETTVVHEGLGA